MKTINKEQTLISFLEAANNALDIETLFKNTFQVILNHFKTTHINRVQIWKQITNSDEMSVYFEHSEPREKSMIKYRINSLPKNISFEYPNINNENFNKFNIFSLIFTELKLSGLEGFFFILTSKEKNIKFSKEEKSFLLNLISILEPAISKVTLFNKAKEEVKTLKHQNLTLREQEILRTNLINNISHEFRTPLSSILGFSNLLINKKQSEESTKEIAEQIQQAANRISSLLSDFLQANKTTIELWTPRIEPSDLGEIIKTSVEEFAILNRGHKLCYNISDNYPIINTDQKLIRLILDNLISNALKYSPNGGTITVSLELSGSKNEMLVSVADKGIGISSEEQKEIFNRFYRSSNPKIKTITGSGLGLAICKEIITSLNGRIEVKSELNKGSTFTFVLPAK